METDGIAIRIRPNKAAWNYYRSATDGFTADSNTAFRFQSVTDAIQALALFTANYVAEGYSLQQWKNQGLDQVQLVKRQVTEEVL